LVHVDTIADDTIPMAYRTKVYKLGLGDDRKHQSGQPLVRAQRGAQRGRLPHDRRRPARAGLRGRSEILAQDRVSAVARPGILQPAAGGSIPSGSRAAL